MSDSDGATSSSPSARLPSIPGSRSTPAGTRVLGRILVVDSDYDTLGAVAAALRARGHHVVLAADGRGGLQRAVEVAPDIVLVDRDVPIVDVRTFLEVLRDNPRTSGAHALLMGTGDPARLAIIDARAEPIVKPFHTGELTARIEDVLRARQAPRKEPELRGDVAQVSLFDLLQVFAANRRTGTLRVELADAAGEISVREGRIVDATVGGVVGEKALYRVLAARQGEFAFLPHRLPARQRIDAPTDQLLMEAVRHSDELERLRVDLPSMGSVLGAGAGANRAAASSLSVLAREVLGRVDEPRAVEELLDTTAATDLDVLAAIRDLLRSGALVVFDPRGERTRFCDEDEAVALRAAATRLRRPGLEGPPRLGVLSATAGSVSRFARAMSFVDGFVAAAEALVPAGHGTLGSIGVIRLAGTELDLFALPLDASLRPIWGALLAPGLVALHLADEDPIPSEALALLRELGITLVRAPAGWERPFGAVAAVRLALSAVTPAQTDRGQGHGR